MNRENVREMRLQNAGKNRTKEERDNDREITEKIALNQAQPTNTRDALYDQRLFNQSSGIAGGFGEDDDYNLYSKPLFTDRSSASIYRSVQRETGVGLADNLSDGDDGDNGTIKEALKVAQPSRGFEGAAPSDSAKLSKR